MTRRPRPFCLGTTSFIYPGKILPNVRCLGPVFDEIELLVFESLPYQGMDVLPSKEEVTELKLLSRDLDLTYNVHMPVDVSLTDPAERERATETLARVMVRMEELNPTTHTLHLAMEPELATRLREAWAKGDRDETVPVSEVLFLEERVPDLDPELGLDLADWQEQAMEGLYRFWDRIGHGRAITLETLDYPPQLLDPILDEFSMGMCIDAGHHFFHGFDLEETFAQQGYRVPLVHLHGVASEKGKLKDHLGLDRMDPTLGGDWVSLLEQFTGTVSLECFSLETLNGSLAVLEPLFEGIPSPLPPTMV